MESSETAGLFAGLSAHDVEALTLRLNGVRRTYRRGETVVHAGLKAERLMLVQKGRLRVYENTGDDRAVLVREIGPGEALGLWILYMPDVTCWPGSVEAVEESALLSLDLARARTLFAEGGAAAARLADNAARLLARELFAMWRKVSVMDASTIEARVRIYLTTLDNESGNTGTVVAPLNRARMAEYFGVSRPSLSRTLCQMRDRGLLAWRRNVFEIKF